MNSSNRFCQIKGHEELLIYHICTLLECNQRTRWCCPECISDEIHKHEQPNNSHVMRIKEFLIKLQFESDKLKQNLESQKTRELLKILETIVKKCQGLENSIIDYRRLIESYIQNIKQQQEEFQLYQNNLFINNFEKLDSFKINELVNINLQQDIQNLQFMPLDNFKQQLYSIESIIITFQETKCSDYNPIIDLKKIKYIIQEIDQTIDCYYGSSISKNEKYLAYGGHEKLLKIYDLKQKQLIKEIKLDYQIVVCQFTQDSTQLYVGLSEGYACGYDVQDDFKEINKQQIHSSHVYNLITINNEYLITCSYDQSIIKTDIKSKQQIFKLPGQTNLVLAIDYNDKDEIVVCGSSDKSIKLWDCRNQSIIINKEQSHSNQIRQIQLINNNQNILSLDFYGNLYKWKIDLQNKDIIKQQQFSDKNKIFNFYQVNQDLNLLLICNNYAKILNQYGETINTIEHGGKDGYEWHCRQLDNLKYIQIRTQKKIILAIAQD